MKQTDKIFDGLLVLQYKAGDKGALNLLVKRHHLGLCKHAYWYTEDLSAAKDIVQDSWKVMLLRIKSLRDPNGFRAWAMKIVTRKALDYIKINKRNRERIKQYDPTLEDKDASENGTLEIMLLQRAIKELPQDQQIVLKLFYTQEYSLTEISNILEIPKGTVKSRLFHAREKLKKIIKHTYT